MLLPEVLQKSPKSICIHQQWKANAYTFGCGLRCCMDTGVWRYRDVATELIHTFLFALCRKKETENEEIIITTDNMPYAVGHDG